MIIKPSSLGDIVHTLPAVALLREAHPGAEITWVINPEFAPLLRGNSDVNHVHFFPRGQFRGLGAPRSLLPWLKKTRGIRPDLALDFQGLLRSALIARISGAIRWPLPTGDPLPRFDEYPPFILLHPFARGDGKSLSNAVIEEFCGALAPTRVVVVGQSRRKIDTPGNCIDLTNQTSLLQLIRLIRVARFVVSVDSGPMHIAAAVTDNLLSIHTWTDPRRVGPYNRNAWVWKNGLLLRVSELEIAKLRRRGRRFRCKDVPAAAELIRPLVPVDPMLA